MASIAHGPLPMGNARAWRLIVDVWSKPTEEKSGSVKHSTSICRPLSLYFSLSLSRSAILLHLSFLLRRPQEHRRLTETQTVGLGGRPRPPGHKSESNHFCSAISPGRRLYGIRGGLVVWVRGQISHHPLDDMCVCWVVCTICANRAFYDG